MSFNQESTMKKLSSICAALLLSACGGGGGSTASTPPYVPAPTPAPTADVFYTRVLAFVSAQSETDEPGDIAAVTVTEPEMDEAVAL
jgi:ABC-type sugar transport system substrate-binding protein